MSPPRGDASRRAYLAALAATGALGLAGCSEGSDGGSGSSTEGDGGSDGASDGSDGGDDGTAPTGTEPSDDVAPEPETPVAEDVELPVPKSELNRGAAKDAIPAITDPAFGADWSTADASLSDDDRVIGVVSDGRARAYPLSILNWHEIVNDEFGGLLLVTFCPLCGSAMTAERTADGEVTTFGVSGLLWQSDLVMYDAATDSLWSQILATAIRGDLTGEELRLVPSAVTTWGEWRSEHAATEVLLPPPESGTIVEAPARNYDTNPYAGYEDAERVGIGYNEFDDERLHPKAQVIGVATEDAARAYPLERVLSAGVVNDTVGDRPVVVTTTGADSLVAYDRRVDSEVVAFEAAGTDHVAGGGSRWQRTTGEAVDGPHEGTSLERANGRSQMFWFAWLDFHEGTSVYGEG